MTSAATTGCVSAATIGLSSGCCRNSDGRPSLRTGGDFASINAGPAEARASGATMIGTGLTPEGVWHNAVAFDLMNENSYRSSAVDLEEWVAQYSARRYHATTPVAAAQLAAAWQILRR